MEANDLNEIFIDYVAWAGNPAHVENPSAKKKGFAGAKIHVTKDGIPAIDPSQFVEAINKEHLKIGRCSAELYSIPESVLVKDYVSVSGEVGNYNEEKYISYQVRSTGAEDPTSWVMHLKDVDGKVIGVTLKFGISKDIAELNTLYFNKDRFNVSQVKQWLQDHNVNSTGEDDMSISKEDLAALVSSKIEEVVKPLSDKLTAMEAKLTPPVDPAVKDAEAKKEADAKAKKDAEDMAAMVAGAVKEAVAPIVASYEARLANLEGTTQKSQTDKLGKDQGTIEDEDVLYEDDQVLVKNQNKWQHPQLRKMDQVMVRKVNLKKNNDGGTRVSRVALAKMVGAMKQAGVMVGDDEDEGGDDE